ncbi:hypothetical protein K8I31_03970 [bacterium]|nr:hypothetical protein [bacterium]
MNDIPTVERDERTIAVENEGIKLAYIFIVYGLLLDVMYRGWFLDEAAWDLIAFVILGGVVTMLYQIKHKAVASNWVKRALLISLLGGVISFIIAAVLAAVK